MDYRIERISIKCYEDIISLYKDCFHAIIDKEFLNKKLNTSTFGISYLGYIAYDVHNKPAAYYAVYPCFLTNGKDRFLAAQSGDTMTHPNHRGQGLFVRLAQKTYELCKESNVRCVFGFPNENSYPGFVRKLNWQHVDDMRSFIVRVKSLPWVRVQKALPFLDKMHGFWCKLVLNLVPKGEVFNASTIGGGKIGIDHSREFFNYKAYGNNKLIRLKKSTVWVKTDVSFLWIGDMSCKNEAEIIQTIKRLKRIAFFCGLTHLRITLSSDVFLETYFSQYGQIMEAKYPVGVLSFDEERDFANCKFVTGDNDTF